MGQIYTDHSEANRRWVNPSKRIRQFNSYRELLEIDEEPNESEWHTFPGITSLEILQKIQEDLQDRNIEPENFANRIIFISMTSNGQREEIQKTCTSNSRQVRQCFESWNSEKKEKQRHHTLQCGCFEHRTLISNASLSKSAQYPRSSLRLV